MSLGRVARADRMLALDVLRGIAILLILLMNIQYTGDFANPDYFPRRVSWTGFDQAAWWLNRLIDGTQRGLLELLFGAGVLIMARGAMTPDGPVAVADLHMRRNLWLMAFGVAHGVLLLWPGDILLSYGTAALLVFPFRTLAVKWLLIIGIAIGALVAAPDIADYRDRVALVAQADAGNPAAQSAWRQIQADTAAPDAALLAADQARVLGGWPEFIGYQHQLWVFVQFTGLGIYFENIIEAFGTMLIGMALFKLGIIQGAARPRSYWLLLIAGYGIGLGLRIPATIADLRFDARPDIGMFTEVLARLPMTLGHVGAVLLALRSDVGGRLLAPFRATGQMPLTVYLSASAAAVLLFGGPCLGLWGRFGYGGLLLIALAVIAAQLVFANLWLRRFATGPAEWLWKSLSYAQRQPMLREAG